MKYCPNCGTGHDCEAEDVAGVEKTAVAIARLETNRDIEVARLQAGAVKHVADAEAESEADHLEGVIEGVELATGEGEPDTSDPAPSIVVQADAPEDDAPDVEEPPEVEPVIPAEPENPGWWSAYR